MQSSKGKKANACALPGFTRWTGGLLTSVKAHFGSISHEINQLIELDVYKKTNELIDEACSEVRRIAHNMIPHSLQMHGLEGAITDFESFISKNGITPHIEVFQVDLKNISENNAALIYRILQEVIQNIIKHAKATEITIQFWATNKASTSKWMTTVKDLTSMRLSMLREWASKASSLV
ncbi:MAG: hypothetical protein IPL23_10720 [Saprospiraceae bacterium]|nr:hypothetical protein [Saprospiraceae bacterium]